VQYFAKLVREPYYVYQMFFFPQYIFYAFLCRGSTGHSKEIRSAAFHLCCCFRVKKPAVDNITVSVAIIYCGRVAC